MAEHSSIVGGSTAERLLGCPASWSEIRKLPPAAVVASEYAEEGTFAHECMSRALRIINFMDRIPMGGLHPHYLVGMEVYDRVVTAAHLNELILPALAQLAQLERIYGGDFQFLTVEQTVQFPGIPHAFGTCDLIVKNDKHLVLVDWKFGRGVPVRATYDHGDGTETVNPQLMFYAAAALNTPKIKQWFAGVPGRNIVLAIIQPRTATPLTHTVVKRAELRRFVEDIHAVVSEAFSHAPRRTRGEHCRFAPCKVSCPLWTGPLLDLTALGVEKPAPATAEITPYAAYLAAAKRLLDAVELMRKDVDAQMHAYLSNGGAIPGWKLKAKAKQRKWIDPVEVEATLNALGFRESDIFTRELVTFAAAEATAKRLKVKIPEHLRQAPPATETTIAPTDDPAPAVEPRGAAAVEQFRQALRALTGPEGERLTIDY
jgi:hypothetical protein